MSVTSNSPFGNNVLLLFKSDLLEQQRNLTYAMDRAQKEIRALVDSGPGDVIDEWSGNASKEAAFATYSHNRTQLRNVEHALERMSTGDFGTCSMCGDAIGLKRLQAVPWVSRCIECQEACERGKG